jgi:hypothetical protein
MDTEEIEFIAREIWIYLSESYKVDVDIEDIVSIIYTSLR